jgi:UDP-glucuronate decarboxylase
MHEDDGRVVSNFVLQALRGLPITMYGDGSQTRSFCYCSDLIEGFLGLMNLPEDPGPVNLGNPRESTIKELAEMVVKLIGSKSELRFDPLPVDDPTRRCPDITKARRVLGWEPKVPLEQGLERTIQYMRDVVLAERASA